MHEATQFLILLRIQISTKLSIFFLRKKYNKNIDDVYLKDENQEPKKWSLFGIVTEYTPLELI